MNRIVKTSLATAIVLGLGVTSAYAFGGPGRGDGPCGGGQARMERDGGGFGLMGGRGHRGGLAGDRQLTVEQVRDIYEGKLAMRGNDRLKVGAVEQKDENTVTVQIVTVDNSLVQTLDIDRKTGRPQRAN